MDTKGEYEPLSVVNKEEFDVNLSEANPPAYVDEVSKFPTRPQYQNPWVAVLFILHLMVLGGLFGVGVVSFSAAIGRDRDVSIHIHLTDGMKAFLMICGSSTLFSSFCAVFWFYLCRKLPTVMIYISIVGTLLLMTGFSVLLLLAGKLFYGVSVVVVVVLMGWAFFSIRSRIPFAATMLSHVGEVLNKYPAIFVASIFGLIVQAIFVIFWFFTLVMSILLFAHSGVIYPVVAFLTFSSYWVVQVIKNIVHVIASGTCATDYFFSGSVNGVPPNPTLNSTKRAFSYSFGAICLGSLVVALVQTLRSVLRSISCRLVDCCLGSWMERLVRYFNLYAFTHVAVYGKAYCDAAKDTYDLFKNSGLEAVANDSLTSIVIAFASVLTAVLTTIYGVLLSAAFAGGDYWIWSGFICFGAGFVICWLPLSLLQSGICTVFVCFAEQPGILKGNNPQLHRQLIETYNLTDNVV